MDILRIEHLSKNYDDFSLKDVNITMPQGSIMGLIGENGAGKSTTIKAMLHLIRPDAGTVFMMGKEYRENDKELKEHIGTVLDRCCFPEEMTAKEVEKVLKHIYRTWDHAGYQDYLKKFSIPGGKMIKHFSRGMKMKLSLAAALSHDTRLLILDEATSGLDPVVRDEILDILREFIMDETHGVLISSHIVSDLEKICDYITFIQDGTVLFSENKDELMEKYCVVKCRKEELEALEPSALIGMREHAFGVEALVERSAVPADILSDAAGIEEIMLHFSKR